MHICPDCYQALKDTECSNCTWTLEHLEGIPVYFSSKDKADPTFKRYLNNYDQISIDDLQESIQDEMYLNNQNDKFFSYFPDTQDLSVCEVGVGKGLLLNHLSKTKPKKLVGIDISLPYLTSIKSRHGSHVEMVVANAENIPYENEFDIIIASDIIEHVFNVGDFLTSVNRALKPNGRFIVKVPYNEDINGYSIMRGCKYDFVHLRNFNKQTLTTVLKGAGFKVNTIIYDGFYPARKRSYIKNISFLNTLFDQFVERKFDGIYDVNRINNFLGNLLMNPVEITAIVSKSRELSVVAPVHLKEKARSTETIRTLETSEVE